MNTNKIDNEIDMTTLISLLSSKHRAIVALISGGFSQKDAAMIVGLTRAAVGASYKQALTLLRGVTDDRT